MNRVHVGLGHLADDDLVVGAVEQLVVIHDAVHSLRHFFLVASGRVPENFRLNKIRTNPTGGTLREPQSVHPYSFCMYLLWTRQLLQKIARFFSWQEVVELD